jgi:hypothetical protein
MAKISRTYLKNAFYPPEAGKCPTVRQYSWRIANLLKMLIRHTSWRTALLRLSRHSPLSGVTADRLAPFEHLNIARSEAKSRFMLELFGSIFFSAGLSDEFLAEQADMSHFFFDNGFDAVSA